MALDDRLADRVAAGATAIGVGLISFMLTWTIGARITERLFQGAAGAYVAMATAIVVGIAVTRVSRHHLVARASTVDAPSSKRP
jgi:hypothetical protein